MKKYFTLLWLLGSAIAPRLAAASPAPALLQTAPPAEQPRYACARPLVRYLTATLRLTPSQAAAVQQVLRTETPRPLAPEQLTQSLTPVLTPEAQERLQTLQASVDGYRTLYYLAARH